MGELDDIDAVELIRTQSRVNVPSQGPAPVPQDGIRGNAQPRYQRPRAAPAQAAPAQPMPAPQQQPDMPSDPVDAWIGMMNKHGIDRSKWPSLSDQYYEIDRNGQVPRTGNPALDNDLTQYARRFPKQGQPTPQPQSPQLPQPPAAQQQLGAAPRQQGMPPAPMDELGDVDAMDVMRGPAQRQAAAPRAADPNAEPDAPTWLGRRMQDVRGRQDPRFAGLPNIASVIQKRGQSWGDIGGETFSWAVGASDKDMARTYQAMLGRDYIRTEQDANGYPVIVYRDNGQEAKAYVNNPGIDMQDVARGAFGGLAFAKAGQLIGRATQGAPLAGRVFAQGGGQAATSIAQDATAVGSGVSDLDPVGSATKAGVAGAAGMGGELVGAALGPVIRRFITEPRLFDRANGTLTQQGAEAARRAGLDPETFSQQVAQEFSKAFAKTGNAEGAFRQAASKEAGIRRTTGELTQDTNQLLREQQMRGGTYGPQAREMVRDFDEMQRGDIVRATRGVSPPGSANPTIPSQIAPERNYQLAAGIDKMRTGENIAGNNRTAYSIAKDQEKQAWDNVPSVKATPEALAELNTSIATKFDEIAQASGRPLVIDEALTPAATRMAKMLEEFQAGKAPAKASSILPDNTVGDVDTMRRRLLEIRKSAKDDTDGRASRAVYDAFIDWQVVAAEKAGDIIAAAKARTARETTRQIHEIFKGQPQTPAANILKTVFKTADTPEGVVNALFTGPTSEIKGGSLQALRQLKQAYDTYLEPAAAQTAWNDIRLAYWIKMTSDRGNEAKNPAALASSIKAMFGTQGSVARELYTPAEIASMRRLAVAMDDIKRKNPNTSWSAIGVGALMRDVGSAALKMIGWDSVLGRTVAGTAAKPFVNQLGKVQAGRATGGLGGAQLPSGPAPSLGGYGGALGSQSQQ